MRYQTELFICTVINSKNDFFIDLEHLFFVFRSQNVYKRFRF